MHVYKYEYYCLCMDLFENMLTKQLNMLHIFIHSKRERGKRSSLRNVSTFPSISETFSIKKEQY